MSATVSYRCREAGCEATFTSTSDRAEHVIEAHTVAAPTTDGTGAPIGPFPGMVSVRMPRTVAEALLERLLDEPVAAGTFRELNRDVLDVITALEEALNG